MLFENTRIFYIEKSPFWVGYLKLDIYKVFKNKFIFYRISLGWIWDIDSNGIIKEHIIILRTYVN